MTVFITIPVIWLYIKDRSDSKENVLGWSRSDCLVVQLLGCSGVEGEHTLVISSHEQGGRKVLAQYVQPSHVEVIRDRLFTSDGHTPAGTKKTDHWVQLTVAIVNLA